MKVPSSVKSGSLDVLTGFLGLFLLLVLDFRTNIKFDLRWFFIIGGSSCFVLGFIRGGRAGGKPWLKGLLIISGFSIPFLIISFMGLAFGARVVLVTFLITSALLTFSGVQARQSWLRNKRIVSVTFLLLPLGCVVLASVSLLPPLMGVLSGQRMNMPAPQFSLTTEDRRPLTSADLKGKVVVLAFWATWCEPCWQELPKVEKVYASYEATQECSFGRLMRMPEETQRRCPEPSLRKCD
jgi:AhpC/TSA family